MTDRELKRMSKQELLNELYVYAKANSELHLLVENREEELRIQQKKYEDTLAREQQKQQILQKKLKEAENKNAELSEQLQKRSVVMQDAGNIADATCKITGIFEEAQKTAELYVKNVQEMAARQETVLKELEEKSRRDVQDMGDQASKTCIAMRTQTEKDCARLREKTEAECQVMKKEAYNQAEAYWKDLTERLENFYNAHQGMRELFGSDVIRIPGFQPARED